MHYIIDGYNLLFQGAFIGSKQSLENARTILIHNLDHFAQTLSLSITVIFDAPFQCEDLRRGHFNTLEIIFTSKGQTADEYIVEYVQSRNEKMVVVTSDKGLSRRVKNPNVYTEKVPDFLQKIRKKAQKKQQIPAVRLPKKPAPLPPIETKKAEAKTIDMNNLPPLCNIPAWEEIFLQQLEKKTKNRD
jgi:predicted RNA-binding protein with PIN domain